MAKSLRSKWRRKCRAVKRIRYSQKELERLKRTLGTIDSQDDVIAETVQVDKQTVTPNIDNAQESKSQAEIMEIDKRIFNPKTLKDQNGTYPPWMHPRKIRKQKRLQKKSKKGKR